MIFDFVVSRFGFVEFRSEEDADYAIKIMNMIKVILTCPHLGVSQEDFRPLNGVAFLLSRSCLGNRFG